MPALNWLFNEKLLQKTVSEVDRTDIINDKMSVCKWSLISANVAGLSYTHLMHMEKQGTVLKKQYIIIVIVHNVFKKTLSLRQARTSV